VKIFLNNRLRVILPLVKHKLPALVIDDEPQVSSSIAAILKNGGWDVTEAHNAEEAFEKLSQQDWVLVFCDVVLGGIDGYEVLRRFAAEQPEARFVLMTGYESAAGALDALAIGAYDYLVKPFEMKEISSLADSVRKHHQLRSKPKTQNFKKTSPGYQSEIPLIGRSPAFLKCLKTVGRVAPTNLPVLISGESGTGKEIVAQSIHQSSPRKNAPFVAVNCGAIPVELIESELFGHEKGAFTGADRERIGLWQEADGGTIFLDEITETSLLFQVKLLRALQQGEIRRVGSNRNIKVDVRVIAATNRNIKEEVQRGRFRQDLMYRLNAVTIHLPPLRERTEDIPLLAEYFASRMPLPDGSPAAFSPAAMEMLKNYNWEGNVRELENAVLHAVSLSNEIIYPEHLPETVQQFSGVSSGDLQTSEEASTKTPTSANGEWLTLAAIEAKYAAQVLAHTGWNKQAAARLMGIDYKTLTRIIKRYGIKP
jgi:DNA-binding NtrC family response regulator